MNASHFPSVRDMVKRAKADKDPVSCFVDGGDWEVATGMIVVIKERDVAFKVRNILANAGLLDVQNKI